MGEIVGQKPVKLVCSIIYKREQDLKEAETLLVRAYGDFDEEVMNLPFDYTDYYTEEMGKPLMRKLVSFKRLVSPERLYKVKIKTNRFEDKLADRDKRTVNIDPGYITEAKLLLLTTKDYTHRVYIGGKIFAESTLFFMDGEFKTWPWTYPDYSSDEMRGYFNRVREEYMKETKQG